jgi:diguanylate cyclase (GGDEF)-like protein
MNIKKNILFFNLIWLVLIITSFFWNYTDTKKAQEKLALQTGRTLFNHIEITRMWNSNYGNIYAPVSLKTQANPFLKIPMRDIKINDKLTLTTINPAYMTRQISEIAMDMRGIQFHLTSLKPIRPLNSPTDRETEYLKKFEQGAKEFGIFLDEDINPSFFYMAPLKTEIECLQCHSEQGYKAGDIRGGISVTIPYNREKTLPPLLFGHIVIGIFGLIGIMFAGKRLNQTYEKIQTLALFDSLTGIPNRRYFSESIVRQFKRCQRNKDSLSIILCDIDNFKGYNDTYGHDKGDTCLKKVAEQIKKALNRPDDFCARYGGEEFIVILPDTSLNGAKHVAENIRSNVEELKIPHRHSLPAQVVTLCVGITTAEGTTLDSITHEGLIKKADIALYKAKSQKGKNQIAIKES